MVVSDLNRGFSKPPSSIVTGESNYIEPFQASPSIRFAFHDISGHVLYKNLNRKNQSQGTCLNTLEIDLKFLQK